MTPDEARALVAAILWVGLVAAMAILLVVLVTGFLDWWEARRE